MSTKTMKILTVVATILMIVAMGTSVVYGLTPDELKAEMDSSTIQTDKIESFGGDIMKIINTVGVVLAVVILMILGIKYMMGSAEEKADYKKTMIPYLVGAIFIFGATTLANVVFQFATGI